MPIEQNYINQKAFLRDLENSLSNLKSKANPKYGDAIEEIRLKNLILKTRGIIKKLLGINQKVCFIKLEITFKDGTKGNFSFSCLAESSTEILSIVQNLNEICPMQNPVIEVNIIGRPKIIKLCTLYNSN